LPKILLKVKQTKNDTHYSPLQHCTKVYRLTPDIYRQNIITLLSHNPNTF